MTGISWIVSEAGYGWDKPLPGSDSSPILVVRRPWPTRSYFPLEEVSGLFLLFADLDPTPTGVRVFASEYGHLGEGFIWVEGHAFDSAHAEDTAAFNGGLAERTAMEPGTVGLAQAENLGMWETEISRMKTAVRVWKSVKAGNANPDKLADVCATVNRGMAGRVMPVTSYNQKRRTCGLSYQPHNLLGALWCQFADTLANGKEPRRCPVCLNWFVVAPGRARTDKAHCSLGCRQKAYRNRKERALELHAKNHSPKEIADQVGSDLKVVKRWLKAAKQDDGGQEDDGRLPNCDPPENLRGLDL